MELGPDQNSLLTCYFPDSGVFEGSPQNFGGLPTYLAQEGVPYYVMGKKQDPRMIGHSAHHIVGLDFAIRQEENGQLTPVLIEINTKPGMKPKRKEDLLPKQRMLIDVYRLVQGQPWGDTDFVPMTFYRERQFRPRH